MSPDPTDISCTRQRLLDAAAAVFAEHGYRSATVRDICARAGANIAAVNYHFGDKEGLYAAVMEAAWEYARDTYPPDGGVPSTASAEERLRGFVQSFIAKLLSEGRPDWHVRIFSREMIEPTRELDRVVERSIRPQFELLCGILRSVMGLEAAPGREAEFEDMVGYCGASVVGQCLHYHHSREVCVRLYPGMTEDPTLVECLTEHVYAFSLHGIRGMAADAMARGLAMAARAGEGTGR
jgi:AcrR family transcriptional regulator